MKRISRRRIERGLRLPVPAPGAELGRRIKDQIPDDLFAAPDDASRRDRISTTRSAAMTGRARLPGHPAVWAVAASVVVALGAGWLAVRLFETDSPLSPMRVAVAPAEPESAPPAALDRLAPSEVGEADSPAPPSSPPEPAVESRAAARRDSATAGVAPGAAAPAPAQTERSRATAFDQRESAALAPASPPSDRPASREMESLNDGQVVAKRVLAKRALDSARIERVVGDLLDSAADRAGARSAAAIAIDGTTGRVPGRLLLLVSATVRGGGVSGNAAQAADLMELQLDPGLVSGHRLLASHARDLGPDATSASAATRAAGARRVTALYQLEVAGDLDRTAVLGTARLRDDGKAKDAQESTGRSVIAADLARDRTTADVSIRLAALGAEIALLPDDAPPEVVASLRAELARLRNGTEVDEITVRRADELLDVLSR